ncbi:DUF3347 domain-containing protein [Sphingobacterium sp. lm-10]|uniref:DUF3347 domain-containing protein n=1 Tax=Sphingobacterium sp. lm-10 TaxID=2944904 RepID=UPI0020224CC3|nr:DUF3347 domain-containing protein [Sphingobacterium sp. lm-10]MCL7988981.1 DUF3347 domain-containing protein [Sphingobacterium sp. lm-10]
MKLITYVVLAIAVFLSVQNSFAQIKNLKTEIVKVNGNCEMCKETIEKAGNIKNVSNVVWNGQENKATLSYDTEKTSSDDILKQIALAGYDNAKFRAPDEVYASLHECCQYDREIKSDNQSNSGDMSNHSSGEDHQHVAESNATHQGNQLDVLFASYFSLKDALVKENQAAAAKSAVKLAESIKAVEMNTLTSNEHEIWMKVVKLLTADVEKMVIAKQIADQRKQFIVLSEHMFALAKGSELGEAIYYQQCPMANDGKGATWLSKESEIKNPYYGSKMLSCGSTIETIK